MSPSRSSHLPWPLKAHFLQWVGGVGASGWQHPLRITAPGPQVRFFRRCSDGSPGAAPGTGREGVGGQLLDTATHNLWSGRARGQEDTFEPESQSQTLCSSSMHLQCPRPGWRVVAGGYGADWSEGPRGFLRWQGKPSGWPPRLRCCGLAQYCKPPNF